jgi:hypothetical protein
MPHTAYTPHSPPKRIEGDLCPQCQMPMGIIRIEALGGKSTGPHSSFSQHHNNIANQPIGNTSILSP